MVIVGATIRLKKGKGDEFVSQFRKTGLGPKVRRDPGALLYTLHRDIADPDRFFFWEKYESDEAVKYHGSAPHVREFFQTIGPMMEGKLEIIRYEEIN